MNRPRQLALALPHTESFAREDFLPGPGNDAALALIDRWPDWPAPVVVLAGPAGAGKTHLATVWRAVSNAVQVPRAAIPGAVASLGGRSALIDDTDAAPLGVELKEQTIVGLPESAFRGVGSQGLRDLTDRRFGEGFSSHGITPFGGVRN